MLSRVRGFIAGHRNHVALIVIIALVVFLFLHNRERFGDGIQDDAYISFRYAQNLAEGRGLVFNPGERVEGYSNFLWTVLMSVFFPIGSRPEFWANRITIAFSVLTLVFLVLYSYKKYGGLTSFVGVAALFLATNRTFLAWSTGGLEMSVFTFFTTSAVLTYFYYYPARIPGFVGVLFLLSSLTRNEGHLFFTLCFMISMARALKKGDNKISHLGWSRSFIFPIIIYHGFRMLYFGDILPNTYYAKSGGLLWIEQGSQFVKHFFLSYNLSFFLAVIILAFLLSPKNRVFKAYLMAALAIWAGYVINTGGDFMEFRIFMPLLGIFYFAFQDSLRDIHSIAGTGLKKKVMDLFIVLVVASLLYGSQNLVGDYSHPRRLGRQAEYEIVRRINPDDNMGLTMKNHFYPGEKVATWGMMSLAYYSQLYFTDGYGLINPDVKGNKRRPVSMAGHRRPFSQDYFKENNFTVILATHGGGFGLSPTVEAHPEIISVKFHNRYINFRSFRNASAYREELVKRGFVVVYPNKSVVYSQDFLDKLNLSEFVFHPKTGSLFAGVDQGENLFDPAEEEGPSMNCLRDLAKPVSGLTVHTYTGCMNNYTGSVKSREFTVDWDYLYFKVAGGDRYGSLSIGLRVNGTYMRYSTGPGMSRMTAYAWNVSDLKGEKAVVEIQDNYAGHQGYLMVSEINGLSRKAG